MSDGADGAHQMPVQELKWHINGSVISVLAVI